MPLTSVTTITTNVSGTDANGNVVNQNITTPAVVNTAIQGAYSTYLPFVTGDNTINVPSIGAWKTCTVTPPANNNVTIQLGSSSGLSVAPGQPFSFGIPSGASSLVLHLGTTTEVSMNVTFA